MTSTQTSGSARGNASALALGTVAFMACFFAWSLLGPLGPDLQDHLDLSEFQLAIVVAVPVLLGSLMRIPSACSLTATAAGGCSSPC